MICQYVGFAACCHCHKVSRNFYCYWHFQCHSHVVQAIDEQCKDMTKVYRNWEQKHSLPVYCGLINDMLLTFSHSHH